MADAPSDFYATTRWALSMEQRSGEDANVYYDRIELDGVPYRGPRETWSEDQYERRTRFVSEFQNLWFNLFDPKDLVLYRRVMTKVANKEAAVSFIHRETPTPRTADRLPTQWVYLEWIEGWREAKPDSMTIEDLGAPQIPPLFPR